MNLEAKQEVVKDLSTTFSSSVGTYLINYQGCTCADLTSVRRKLRKTGAQFAVVKNTLAKKALETTVMGDLNQFFEGPTAVVWSSKDPVEPAKVIADFAKEQEKFKLKGGWVDGTLIGPKDIESLAKMPSKAELQAKLLSLINAPATQVLRLMNAPASSLARVLNAWKGEIEKRG